MLEMTMIPTGERVVAWRELRPFDPRARDQYTMRDRMAAERRDQRHSRRTSFMERVRAGWSAIAFAVIAVVGCASRTTPGSGASPTSAQPASPSATYFPEPGDAWKRRRPAD